VTANEHTPRLQVGRYSEKNDQNKEEECALIHALKMLVSSVGIVQQNQLANIVQALAELVCTFSRTWKVQTCI
jgi:hypothetical protein